MNGRLMGELGKVWGRERGGGEKLERWEIKSLFVRYRNQLLVVRYCQNLINPKPYTHECMCQVSYLPRCTS